MWLPLSTFARARETISEREGKRKEYKIEGSEEMRYTKEDAEKVLLHVNDILKNAIDFFINMKVEVERTGNVSEYDKLIITFTEWQNELEDHWYSPEEETEIQEYEDEQNRAIEGQIEARLAGFSEETIQKMREEEYRRESEEMDELQKEIANEPPTPGWPLDYI